MNAQATAHSVKIMRVAIRTVLAAVTFTFVALLFQQNNADEHVITGMVIRVAPDTITVLNDQTDPTGLVLSLRDNLRAEGAYPTKIEAGAQVKVWYRLVAERRPIAVKIVMVRGRY